MIFNITEDFVRTCPPAMLSDLCCEAMKHRHFLQVGSSVRKSIRASIVQHASTTQKGLFQHYHGFDLTDELKKYLTTVNIDGTTHPDDFWYLLTQKSLLIVENRHNEWQLYKELTRIYRSDPKFGNLYVLLYEAQRNGLIDSLNAGGWSGVLNEVRDHTFYDKIGRAVTSKLLSLFDRDTDDNTSYDGNKNDLFKFFTSGKDYLHVSEANIYDLSQGDYAWHMWYKRAIENYFPDAQYDQEGVNTAELAPPVNRDYYKFDNGRPHGYEKKKLSNLTTGLTREAFEQGQKHFMVGGVDMSEFELFLLKMVKII